MMGKKVRWVSAGTRDEVSFSFPQVHPGEASCELCCQGFANTRSFKKYMRNHSGDTGYSWEDCSEVLTSRVMPEHVFKVVGRRCNFIVLSVSGVTQPNKPWWLILGLGMGLPLLLESYKVLKTMREPMASIRGLFHVGWMAALLVLSFFFSGHLAERHGSSSCCEQWGCLLYVCTGPSMVIVVFDCLGNLGGGGNQATGQVTSHLLLTPILVVLVTCHWVVLVACHWVVLVAYHWVVLVAYSHFWVLALFLKAADHL